MTKLSNRVAPLGLCAALALMAGSALAQQPTPVKATAGKDMELHGAVVRREGDEFTMRLLDRSEYRVKITDTTTIKTERKGVFRGLKPHDVTAVIDGLVLDVYGVGDDAGRVAAKKIRFSESDLHAAITAQIHSQPVKDSTAAAHERITTTNERISALDDWKELGLVSVFFGVNQSMINDEGKKSLDELAAKAPGASNYTVEITGHTDATGTDKVNEELSAKRSEAVVRYLTVEKNVPLRRIVLPMGYSATRGTADNTTEEGRAKNRRVDVRVLVNEGLSQAATTK